MAHYESDITRFLRDLKEKNPRMEEGQRAGRALLWEKQSIDLDETLRAKKALVRQKPYVYQTAE
jgi:hypothetical protein